MNENIINKFLSKKLDTRMSLLINSNDKEDIEKISKILNTNISKILRVLIEEFIEKHKEYLEVDISE